MNWKVSSLLNANSLIKDVVKDTSQSQLFYSMSQAMNCLSLLKVLGFRQNWYDNRHRFKNEPQLLEILLVHSLNIMMESVFQNIRFANLYRLYSPTTVEKLWTHLLQYSQHNKYYT